jgi:hypothetical protein
MKTDHRRTDCECTEHTELAQDGDQWQGFVCKVINLRILQKKGIGFLDKMNKYQLL